jgi:predicted HTH transcriptional regulator
LIKPQLYVTTDVISITIDTAIQNILVVFVNEGVAKPYKDNQGRIWIKQGSDKRIVTDNNEQIRLFQQSGMVYVDEMIIPNTSIADIDEKKVMDYLDKIGDDTDLPSEQIYKNINLLRNDCLTLGGLMFFAQNPQNYRSAFCVKAISFIGNDIEGTEYRDSEDIDGSIPEMFEKSMSFFNRNLKHTQQGQNFNSTGILEVSPIALEELLQNALTHRDYYRNSPVCLFIFDNRIELISPGRLPNSLTIDNIKMGNAVVRNPLIVSYASKIMKYRGIGSGIRRALKAQPNIELINDIESEQFKVIIPRPIQ